jgi:hypothetical protein
MILGPLLLVVFLVAFAVAWAITRQALNSLAIAGAVTAMPVGAYFGGFWGFLLGAAVGALVGAAIPGLAMAGVIGIVIWGCLAALLYGLDAIAESIGVSFQTLFGGLLVTYFGIGYFWMFLTAPISNRDRESVLDKIKNRMEPAEKSNVEKAHESLPRIPPHYYQVVNDLDDEDDEGQREA